MTTLTPENSKSIVKLAALNGSTPDQLANQPLAETLEEFANQNSGSFGGFLGAILLKCRSQEAANRWIGARLKHRLLCYKIQKKLIES
jgi:hypothetical protein